MDELSDALKNDSTENIVKIRDKCLEIIKSCIEKDGGGEQRNIQQDPFAEGNFVSDSIRNIVFGGKKPLNKKVVVGRYVGFITKYYY